MSEHEQVDIEAWLNPEAALGDMNEASGGTEAPAAEPTAATTDPAKAEPEIVLTADGRHAIPYAVLQAAREEAAALRAQLAQQQAQPAAATDRATPEPGEDPTGTDWARLMAEAQADGDRELEAMARAGLANQQRLERLEATVQAQQAQAQQADDAVIAAAVRGNPDMALWAGDPGLLALAQSVENALLALPQSGLAKAKDWPSYFAVLAAAVQTAYPDMPRATPVSRETPDATAEADYLPRSISELGGGIAPGAAGVRNLADLARLPRSEQGAFLRQLHDSGKLFDVLDDLPVGALNAGRN